jgi:hypothetical protein
LWNFIKHFCMRNLSNVENMTALVRFHKEPQIAHCASSKICWITWWARKTRFLFKNNILGIELWKKPFGKCFTYQQQWNIIQQLFRPLIFHEFVLEREEKQLERKRDKSFRFDFSSLSLFCCIELQNTYDFERNIDKKSMSWNKST